MRATWAGLFWAQPTMKWLWRGQLSGSSGSRGCSSPSAGLPTLRRTRIADPGINPVVKKSHRKKTMEYTPRR